MEKTWTVQAWPPMGVQLEEPAKGGGRQLRIWVTIAQSSTDDRLFVKCCEGLEALEFGQFVCPGLGVEIATQQGQVLEELLGRSRMPQNERTEGVPVREQRSVGTAYFDTRARSLDCRDGAIEKDGSLFLPELVVSHSGSSAA